MANIVGVPTLGASLMIYNPGDILLDVVRRFQVNYEGSSDITPTMTESYQSLISHYGDDRGRLAGEVKRALERIYRRIYPNDTVNVTVTTESGTPNNTYSLIIKVNMTYRGVYYTISPTIKLVNGIPVISNDKVTYVTLNQLPNA